MKLLIAIPCFNEEKTVGEVIRNIPKYMDNKKINYQEVLVVDDGSTDNTVFVAKKEGATVISHSSNRGVGVALQTAFNYAIDNNFHIMVNIDADNQFNPRDIIKLIEPILEKKADMVTASRFLDKNYIPKNISFVKKYGNIYMSKLISTLSGEKFFDVSCGFRAYSREALLNLNLHGKFTYTQETFLDLTYKGMRIMEVPVDVKYYSERKSKVASSIIRYAIRSIIIIMRIYRDYHPLRFFGAISILFWIIAFIFGDIFIGHYLHTGKFSGYLYAGFISGFSFMIGFVLFIVAIAMDMLVRVRQNQERILLLLKKKLEK